MQIREWASKERQKDGAAAELRRRRLAHASLPKIANFERGSCCIRKCLNSMLVCAASRTKVQLRSDKQ